MDRSTGHPYLVQRLVGSGWATLQRLARQPGLVLATEIEHDAYATHTRLRVVREDGTVVLDVDGR
jgi:hypothetical protein